jgi:hypothetical protein
MDHIADLHNEAKCHTSYNRSTWRERWVNLLLCQGAVFRRKPTPSFGLARFAEFLIRNKWPDFNPS